MSNDSAIQGISCRLIAQQCLSASLMVQPASENEDAKYVKVGNALVVYVSFFKDSNDATVDKIVSTIMNMKLSESKVDGKRVSICELPGDILIIPQATLGGKLKGKSMQYHYNIAKEEGLRLYEDLIQKCQAYFSLQDKCIENNSQIKYGTYGNRQVLSMDTNGPFTHMIEI